MVSARFVTVRLLLSIMIMKLEKFVDCSVTVATYP